MNENMRDRSKHTYREKKNYGALCIYTNFVFTIHTINAQKIFFFLEKFSFMLKKFNEINQFESLFYNFF